MCGAKRLKFINCEFVIFSNMGGFHECLSLDVHVFGDVIVLSRDVNGEVICVWNVVSVGREEGIWVCIVIVGFDTSFRKEVIDPSGG